MKMKLNMKIEELCEGLPQEFINYFIIVKKLSFEEEPNYELLREMFEKLL